MKTDLTTALFWAQNPYYQHLKSLDPIRHLVGKPSGCCGKPPTLGPAIIDQITRHPSFVKDMQFMMKEFDQKEMQVKFGHYSTTISLDD